VQSTLDFSSELNPIKANILINSQPNAPAPIKNVLVFDVFSTKLFPNKTL
jgi:hypothetical protein